MSNKQINQINRKIKIQFSISEFGICSPSAYHSVWRIQSFPLTGYSQQYCQHNGFHIPGSCKSLVRSMRIKSQFCSLQTVPFQAPSQLQIKMHWSNILLFLIMFTHPNKVSWIYIYIYGKLIISNFLFYLKISYLLHQFHGQKSLNGHNEVPRPTSKPSSKGFIIQCHIYGNWFRRTILPLTRFRDFL